jgi:hypothetical protein
MPFCQYKKGAANCFFARVLLQCLFEVPARRLFPSNMLASPAACWLLQQHAGFSSSMLASPAARWLLQQHAGVSSSTLASPAARWRLQQHAGVMARLIIICNLGYGFVGVFLDTLSSASYDISTRQEVSYA